MITQRLVAVTTVVGAIAGLSLAVQVRAGADRIAFPEDYAKGVMYLSVDKPSKQVHEFYAPAAALAAARKGDPMPDGTVITGVHYNAQLDGDGNPVKGPDGHFIKTTLRQYAVMQKKAGWGADYGDDVRNGDWEYRIFTAEKKPNDQVKTAVCFGCHKPEAAHDFVYSYDKLKAATQ